MAMMLVPASWGQVKEPELHFILKPVVTTVSIFEPMPIFSLFMTHFTIHHDSIDLVPEVSPYDSLQL